jgi:hypothetical protein
VSPATPRRSGKTKIDPGFRRTDFVATPADRTLTPQHLPNYQTVAGSCALPLCCWIDHSLLKSNINGAAPEVVGPIGYAWLQASGKPVT